MIDEYHVKLELKFLAQSDFIDLENKYENLFYIGIHRTSLIKKMMESYNKVKSFVSYAKINDIESDLGNLALRYIYQILRILPEKKRKIKLENSLKQISEEINYILNYGQPAQYSPQYNSIQAIRNI